TFVDPATGDALASAVFGQAASIWRLNFGWASRADRGSRGFKIDMQSGKWLRRQGEPDPPPEEDAPGGPSGQDDLKQVVPFVEDRRNILLLNLAERLSDAALASLHQALKRGIEPD